MDGKVNNPMDCDSLIKKANVTYSTKQVIVQQSKLLLAELNNMDNCDTSGIPGVVFLCAFITHRYYVVRLQCSHTSGTHVDSS
jgi:hypothetical protein